LIFVPLLNCNTGAYRTNGTDVGRILKCVVSRSNQERSQSPLDAVANLLLSKSSSSSSSPADADCPLHVLLHNPITLSQSQVNKARSSLLKKDGVSIHCVSGRQSLSGRLFRLCIQAGSSTGDTSTTPLGNPSLHVYELPASTEKAGRRWNSPNYKSQPSSLTSQISSAIDVLTEATTEVMLTAATQPFKPLTILADPSHPRNFDLLFSSTNAVVALLVGGGGDASGLQSPLNLSVNSFEDREDLIVAFGLAIGGQTSSHHSAAVDGVEVSPTCSTESNGKSCAPPLSTCIVLDCHYFLFSPPPPFSPCLP
jgi:hypothetical protein